MLIFYFDKTNRNYEIDLSISNPRKNMIIPLGKKTVLIF